MDTAPVVTPVRRVGRPCAVCALPPDLRTATETALASGRTISSIARQPGAPSRSSLHRHIAGGHLPAALQDAVERLTGMDTATIAARLVDIASRARTSALEAAEAGHHAALARANDSELRALQALAGMGYDSEQPVAEAHTLRALSLAAIEAARENPAYAAAFAIELDRAGHVELADQLVQDVSGNEDNR